MRKKKITDIIFLSLRIVLPSILYVPFVNISSLKAYLILACFCCFEQRVNQTTRAIYSRASNSFLRAGYIEAFCASRGRSTSRMFNLTKNGLLGSYIVHITSNCFNLISIFIQTYCPSQSWQVTIVANLPQHQSVSMPYIYLGVIQNILLKKHLV